MQEKPKEPSPKGQVSEEGDGQEDGGDSTADVGDEGEDGGLHTAGDGLPGDVLRDPSRKRSQDQSGRKLHRKLEAARERLSSYQQDRKAR